MSKRVGSPYRADRGLGTLVSDNEKIYVDAG